MSDDSTPVIARTPGTGKQTVLTLGRLVIGRELVAFVDDAVSHVGDLPRDGGRPGRRWGCSVRWLA